MKGEVRITLVKANFYFSRPFRAARQITTLLYLGSIRKKYCILHIAFISSVESSKNCSEFYFSLLFNFLSKQNFLECAFQIKF